MFSECMEIGASRLMGRVCSEQKKKFLIMKIILLTLHCLITTIFISSCIIMKGISMSFRGLKGRESVIILSKVGFLVMGTPLLHLLDIKSRDG